MSASRKLLWLAIGIGFSLAFDLVVAYGLHRYFRQDVYDDSSPTWLIFAVVVAIQFGVATYIGAKRLVGMLVLKTTADSRRIAKMLADEGFPQPNVFHDAGTYLDDVAHDDEEAVRLRLRAAFFKGEMAGYGAATGFVSGIRFVATWDEAIKMLAMSKNIRKPD